MATSSTPAGQAIDTPRQALRDRLLGWKAIMETANPPADRPLDTVGKWLVMTRAAVFPMTVWSSMIGALLAAEVARRLGGISIDWPAVVLAVVGLVIAHAANNLINDYFDTTTGVDTQGYVRALYAPHPILSGWISKAGLRNAILLLTAIDGVIMLVLAYWHGPLVIAFALAGLFLRTIPIDLLRGPAVPAQASRPGRSRRLPDLGTADDRRDLPGRDGHGAALGACLLGAVRAVGDVGAVRQAHRQDRARCGARHPHAAGDPRRAAGPPRQPGADDPVLPAARGDRGRRLGRAVGAAGAAGHPAADRRAARVQRVQAGRSAAVVSARGWPLWFVGWSFVHTRRAGGLLTLGLLINVLVPIRLPWLS